MKNVQSIFERKGSHNIVIKKGASVLEALRVMADKNVGSVIVVNQDNEYLGLITERDYARKVILSGKSSQETKVEEIMMHDIVTVTPKDTIDACMELMTRDNLRYLPVFEAGSFYGVISVMDIVKETIAAQQNTIDHLQSYIHSTV